jgi:hypothetical protein
VLFLTGGNGDLDEANLAKSEKLGSGRHRPKHDSVVSVGLRKSDSLAAGAMMDTVVGTIETPVRCPGRVRFGLVTGA